MRLTEGSKAHAEFKRCVSEGFTICKIRKTLAERGYDLKGFSDVRLIRVWRKCADALGGSG